MPVSGDDAQTRIAKAYLRACRLDMEALKPGNVGLHGAGHDMEVRDFEVSAIASFEAIAKLNLSLGERIYQAIAATHRAVGCNTNLGIVLLCAPLAEGVISYSALELSEAVTNVLRETTVMDTDSAYRAIRLASPGGLGDAPDQDVQSYPDVTLLAAMRLAADRDRIANFYSTGYAALFTDLLPRLHGLMARWQDASWATSGLYLSLLATWPDSHVQRKFGLDAAEYVRKLAQPLWNVLSEAEAPAQFRSDLMALDVTLKSQGLNPGTSADITVASLFAAGLSPVSGQDYKDGFP